MRDEFPYAGQAVSNRIAEHDPKLGEPVACSCFTCGSKKMNPKPVATDLGISYTRTHTY
jgi:hypothetical protein